MKTDSKIKRVKVLGVRIDDVTMEEAIKKVTEWLEDSGAAQNDSRRHPGGRSPIGSSDARLIFTPGPEFLVTAQSDPEFMEILNASDLNIPDGYGLKIFGNITNITPGVDFMLALCKMAAQKSFTVGLLGGTAGVAKKTKDKLETMFSGIKITFAIDGKDADRVVAGYDALRYVDILFVGLGHPKQEKFLASRYPLTSKCFRVGMGVGGSFDLISGKLSRAPGILQKLGLEWLWRLIQEPERFKRIFRATVIFPLMIFKSVLDTIHELV